MTATKYLRFPSANRALGVPRRWTLVIDGFGVAVWYSPGSCGSGLDNERRATPAERARVEASSERRARSERRDWEAYMAAVEGYCPGCSHGGKAPLCARHAEEEESAWRAMREGEAVAVAFGDAQRNR